MRRLQIVMAALISFVCVGSRATGQEEDQQPRLAFFPVFARNIPTENAEILRDALTSALNETGKFRVMSKQLMEANLREAGFAGLDSCATPACGAFFGKLLSADAILQVHLERIDKDFQVTVRLVDVETSRVLYNVTRAYGEDFGSIVSERIPLIAKHLADSELDTEGKYPWYAVAGVLVGVGAVVYFLSETIDFPGFGRHHQSTEKPPGTGEGNQ